MLSTEVRNSQRQELFNILYTLSETKGFRTFSRLPNSEIDYPFVVIGDGTQSTRAFGKFKLNGTLTTRIDVWGSQNDKGTHDLVMFQLEQELINLKRLRTVYVKLEGVQVNVVKIVEGQDLLLHGTIDVSYTYY